MTEWRDGDVAVAEDGTIWQCTVKNSGADWWGTFDSLVLMTPSLVGEEHGPLSGPAVVYPKPMLESLFFDDLVDLISPHAQGCQDGVCSMCDDAHHRARQILRLFAGDLWAEGGGRG